MGDEFKFDKNSGQINIAKDNSTINAEQNKGSKYNITGGNIGAIGDGAKAENFNQYISHEDVEKIDIDFEKILEELIKLRSNLKKNNDLTQDESLMLDSIKTAINGANEEDKSKVILALKKTYKLILPYALNFGLSYLAGLVPKL
jgi:hypothetical protein